MTCRSISLQTAHDWPKAAKWLEERRNPGANVESAVRAILDDVRVRGDEALLEYTRRFDCAAFEPPMRLSEMEIARSAASVSPEQREYIGDAARNIRRFHEAQREKSWFETLSDGSILGQRVHRSAHRYLDALGRSCLKGPVLGLRVRDRVSS